GEGRRGRRETLRNAARQKVSDERAQVAQEADSRIRDLQRQLDELARDKQAARRELDAHVAEVQRRVAAQRSEAQQRREEAMQKINDAIGKADADLALKRGELQRQQDAQLSLQGVNVEHLRQLQVTHDAVHATIEELESKQPLVDRLEKWQAEGGAPHLEDLRSRTTRASEASSGALERLNAFETTAAEATRRVVEGLTQAQRRKVEVESDRMTLEALDALFGEHLAEGESVIDPAMGVLELKGLVQEAVNGLEKLDDKISKAFKNHRQRLTARGGDVAELIEAGLHETRSDPVAKAMSLCENYDQIGPQIVTNLNITLAAILSNVGAFQKQMRTFESEVSTFNAKLQKGLIEVQSFERIKNLEVVIRTNFETLGFYKKLTLMQEVMRQEASVVGRDNAKHLPTKETANALGEFAVVLEKNGDLEVNLSRHISLQGSVEQNGERKAFRNAAEFEHISSEGLTSLILITVMTALLNTIRSHDPVHVPWVTDEVGKFSASNFLALITMLRDNKIDVITASPELGPAQQAVFSKRYLFEDRGRIREFTPTARTEALA
ncbi:MAG TPA: ATP-binding protein, partial [Variovorax sp.]|nr:ATP-binding protein [Variovorax sp.]